MPLLGAVIKQGLKLSSQIRLRFRSPAYYQKKELRNLMKKAENTAFGKKFNFSAILASPDPISEFQDNVPIYNYNSIFGGIVAWPKKKMFAGPVMLNTSH